MYYTIYKITNILDGKFYIGKHKTKDLDDGYMGSGKYIKRAIEKHGVENFKKETLHVFETEAEMNESEARLVVLSEESYNLCPGGHGGFGYINSNGLAVKYTRGFSGRKHSEETKQLLRSREVHWGSKISMNRKNIKPWNVGLKLTDQDKHNKSIAQTGNKNSQFGTMWITNGVEAKKISKESVIPTGWIRGRK